MDELSRSGRRRRALSLVLADRFGVAEIVELMARERV